MAAVDASIFFEENGKITPNFRMVLSEIFSKFGMPNSRYSRLPPLNRQTSWSKPLTAPPHRLRRVPMTIADEAYIYAWTDDALDKFAVALQGTPFDPDTKELLQNYGVSPDG